MTLQTTEAMSMVNARVRMTPDAVTYTDISGHANDVQVSGGERAMGEAFTYRGLTPIITPGKAGSYEVKVKILYTEEAASPYTAVKAAFDAGTLFMLEWSPRGGAVGDASYTTHSTYSFVKSCPPPAGSAEASEPIAIEFVIQTTDILPGVIV